MRLAFADTRWHVADPAFSPAPLDALLSKSYAAERRRQIDLKRAKVNHDRGSPVAGSDTVYLSVVDGEGNACSFINSIYASFGTGIVPAGRGFAVQNRGLSFSLDPAHPNALAPQKRPYHTIIPSLATRDTVPGTRAALAGNSSLVASFGVTGGFMQPQGHLQVVSALIDDGADPQAALDRPRFCLTRPDAARGAGGADEVALEEGIPASTLAALQEMGHPATLVSGYDRASVRPRPDHPSQPADRCSHRRQ